LGLTERVHILENVENEEKYFLLQHCESYCHPSLAEGFGIPPVEAMYFGKPVFLSKYTSLQRLVVIWLFILKTFLKNMNDIYLKGISKFNEDKVAFQTKLKERALEFSYLRMAESYEIYIKNY
jgi:glycosyltransferase involved in cell wall biosynthesis